MSLPCCQMSGEEKKLYATCFVQFKVCYTQVSGSVPAVTHSPLLALDTLHTLLCVHNPTKYSLIYVFTCSCTTNPLVLFPGQLHNENQKCTYTIQQHYFFISFTFIFYCSPCKLHHIHMNFTFIQLYIYMQNCMDGRDTKSQEMASLFRIVHGCVIFVTGITSTYPKITHPRSMLKPLQLHIIYVLLSLLRFCK